MNKIKVLCVPSDKAGCGLHRSLVPHIKLAELYKDDFEVTIQYNIDWGDLDFINQYDILHFHKGIYSNMKEFHNAIDFCKRKNITVVMDIDDYWDVGQFHPNYLLDKKYNIDKKIQENLSKVDYVTTTTEIFANRIKKINSNVKVFANALDSKQMESLRKDERTKGKLNVGFVMGASHEHDMRLIEGMTNRLPKDILNKVQFVLCGYDLNGTITELYKNGETKRRQMLPEETAWFTYEKILTDNYRIISPEYKENLLKFLPLPMLEFTSKESYKRCWTKPVDNFEYMTHYNGLDVLLVPLQDKEFNKYKSELKFIEAGMMNVAVVASNFGPYTIGSKNFFEKGGIINEEGNCILIDNTRAHKEWSKTIEKLVKNPEYVDKLKYNMHNHIIQNYDINKITAYRAEWYKQICKRNG